MSHQDFRLAGGTQLLILIARRKSSFYKQAIKSILKKYKNKTLELLAKSCGFNVSPHPNKALDDKTI